jgi:hypothetical protein
MLAQGVSDPYCRFIEPAEFSNMKKYDVTGVGLNLGTAEEYIKKTVSRIGCGLHQSAAIGRECVGGGGVRASHTKVDSVLIVGVCGAAEEYRHGTVSRAVCVLVGLHISLSTLHWLPSTQKVACVLPSINSLPSAALQ